MFPQTVYNIYSILTQLYIKLFYLLFFITCQMVHVSWEDLTGLTASEVDGRGHRLISYPNANTEFIGRIITNFGNSTCGIQLFFTIHKILRRYKNDVYALVKAYNCIIFHFNQLKYDFIKLIDTILPQNI